MSCHKCKKTKCGCADKPYGIPATFSNDPTVCPPDSEKCTEVFEAECICWPGPDICELDIKKGDRIDEVLEKLILTVAQTSCAGDGADGLPGADGIPGTNGNGIVSALWTSNSAGQPQTTEGTTDTYTITYDNSATDTFLVYNGANGAVGINGTNGTNGISLNWLGSFAVAPVAPNLNDAYYDTVLGTSYIWDGASWQIVAIDGTDGLNGAPGTPGAPGAPGAGNIQTGFFNQIAGNGTFTVPLGVTQLFVEIIAGGAGSSFYWTTDNAILVGGVGGGYVQGFMPVVSGQLINWQVGAGGGFTNVGPGITNGWQGQSGGITFFGDFQTTAAGSTGFTPGTPNTVVNGGTSQGYVTGSAVMTMVQYGGTGQVSVLERYGVGAFDFPVGGAEGGATYAGFASKVNIRTADVQVGLNSQNSHGAGGGSGLGKTSGGFQFNQGGGRDGLIRVTYFI